jgi:hypothetical protein
LDFCFWIIARKPAARGGSHNVGIAASAKIDLEGLKFYFLCVFYKKLMALDGSADH